MSELDAVLFFLGMTVGGMSLVILRLWQTVRRLADAQRRQADLMTLIVGSLVGDDDGPHPESKAAHLRLVDD